MTLRLVVGAATDVGRVRGHNEDSYLVDDQLGLVAVADGMGGHQAGEVASATALEALRAAVGSGAGVRDAVNSANDAVYEKSTTDERLRGMGTTLTAATLAAGGTLLLGHVGDSRAYVFHDHELRRPGWRRQQCGPDRQSRQCARSNHGITSCPSAGASASVVLLDA